MGDMLNVMKDMMKVYMSDKCNKYMDSGAGGKGAVHDPHARGHYDDLPVAKESEEQWMNTLVKQSQRAKPVMEDALFKPVDASSHYDNEPQPGEAGFAPQGRVGSIGGGYEASDFDDIPTLGESTEEEALPTIREYMEWKSKYKKSR